MNSPTHQLYIDDSGQRDYAKPGKAYDLRLTRYFVFGGVLLRVSEAARLAGEIRSLKMDAFSSDDVEVKSSWLRRGDLRMKKYLIPYGISDERLTRFTFDFYDAAGSADLKLIASVVDKELMTERYGRGKEWHTSAAAYEPLVQRVQMEVADGDRVSVFIDRLSGKTKAGNEYEVNLRNHHKRLSAEGSRVVQMPVKCLHSLPKFIDSRESHLVQVSDIVAYNVLRQVRDHGNTWEQTVKDSEMYPWLRRIIGKFRCSSWGKIQGYGVVPFPRP